MLLANIRLGRFLTYQFQRWGVEKTSRPERVIIISSEVDVAKKLV